MTFTFLTKIHLEESQRRAAMRAVNTEMIGKPTCNTIDEEGRIVQDPEVTDEMDAQLSTIYANLARSHELILFGTLDPTTGRFTFSLEDPARPPKGTDGASE